MIEMTGGGLIRASAAAFAAGAAVTPVLGANDKVNVGWIGTGTRGMHVMKMMYQAVPESVVVTGVCDTFEGNLAKGKDQVQTIGTNTPKTYVDYKQLLADTSIDA